MSITFRAVVGKEGSEFFEVQPCTKGFAFCLQDGHSGILHVIDGFKNGLKLLKENGVHGVEGFGPVNGDYHNLAAIELRDFKGRV